MLNHEKMSKLNFNLILNNITSKDVINDKVEFYAALHKSVLI